MLTHPLEHDRGSLGPLASHRSLLILYFPPPPFAPHIREQGEQATVSERSCLPYLYSANMIVLPLLSPLRPFDC